MTAREWITTLALIAGVICFGLFVWDTITTIRAKAATPAPTMVKAGLNTQGLGADQLTKLIEALSKLAENFAKAGPGLASLVGALLFFAIAAVSSGALKDPCAPARAGDAPTSPPAPPGNTAAPAT